MATLVPLPENIPKAIAWSFRRANLNAEDLDLDFQFTDFVV